MKENRLRRAVLLEARKGGGVLGVKLDFSVPCLSGVLFTTSNQSYLRQNCTNFLARAIEHSSENL